MQIQVLKSKLKAVVVTDANKEYKGSLTLDPLLMEAAHLRANEVVHVNSKDGDARIVTYVMEGIRGTGQVELNGGAANFFEIGDTVHVNCYGYIDEFEHYRPRVVVTKDINEVVDIQ